MVVEGNQSSAPSMSLPTGMESLVASLAANVAPNEPATPAPAEPANPAAALEPVAATPTHTEPAPSSADGEAPVPAFLQEMYGDPAAPSGDPANPANPAPAAAEFKIPAEIQAKLDEYEKYKANPLVAKAMEFSVSGEVDTNKFFEAVAGVDHKQFSDLQLKEFHLKSLEGITEDEVKAELEAFSELPKWKQIAEMNPFRQALDAEKEAKLKSVSFQAKPNPDAEIYTAASKAANEALPKVIESFKTKPFFATKITDDMAIAIDDYVKNVHAVKEFKDGKFVGYNTEKSVQNALLVLYPSKVIKDAVDIALSDGGRTFLDRRVRKSTGAEVTNRAVSPKPDDEIVGTAVHLAYPSISQPTINFIKP